MKADKKMKLTIAGGILAAVIVVAVVVVIFITKSGKEVSIKSSFSNLLSHL